MVRFLTWQRVSSSRIRIRNLYNETRILLGYSIFYIIIGYFIGRIILYNPMPIMGAAQFNQDLWYSGLYKIGILLILPSIIYFGIWGYRVKNLLYGWRPNARNIITTIVLVSLAFFLNASHLPLIYKQIGKVDQLPLRLILGILMPLLTAGLPEELFFRGYLQTRLEKILNRGIAVIITSILFMAWHIPSHYLLSNGVDGQSGNLGDVILHTGLPVFIISLLFGYLWSRNRNIIVLILMHWAIDTLPSISSYLGISF